MAFREDTKHAAYERAGGRCECLRHSCAVHYAERCGRRRADGWHAHHVRRGGKEAATISTTCEALCIPCHEAAEKIRWTRREHESPPRR